MCSSKKLFIIPCLLVIVLVTSCKKHYDKSQLIGSWTEIKIIRNDGRTINSSGKPYPLSITTVFTENTFISTHKYESAPTTIVDYTLAGDMITLNKIAMYKIEKLSPDSLIVSTFDQYSSQPRPEDNFTDYYIRKK